MPRGKGLPERARSSSGEEQHDEHEEAARERAVIGGGGAQEDTPAEGEGERTMKLRLPPPGFRGTFGARGASGPPEPSETPEPSQRSAPSTPGARATGGPSPLSPAGRIIGGTVSTLVLVAAAAFVLTAGKPGERAAAPPEPPPAASQQPEPSADVGCEGPDCTGQDPEAMRCGGPHARTVAEAVLGDARVEVRHSQACGAAWARVTGAAPGDTLRISAADASQRGEVGEAGETYTPMVATADPDAPTACVTTPAGAERCTAVSG